ncbi:MAG: MraY family glycosyltransferase [Candidatus Omnitrophota bacterium]|jgi:UDP-GlcNAc:undecaprenyl-phosphate GlcNAc-1-phosphate transferase
MSQIFKMAIIAAAAFASSFLLTAVYIYVAKKQRFFPGGTDRIPSGAGLIFGICSLGAAFLFRQPGNNAVFLPAVFMLLSGILDDIFEFTVAVKILAQIVAVALLVHSGVMLRTGAFSGALDAPLTFIWVIGIANAFNYLDIVDGLAASIGIVSASAFFIVFIISGSFPQAALCLALSGALSGFIFSNYPPARVYMGNTGSHFIGFILALSSLSSPAWPSSAANIIPAALFIVGVPVFDTAFVTLFRFFRRQPVFKKSSDHLALCLLREGFRLKDVLKIMIIVSGFLCVSGVLVSLPSVKWISAATLLPAVFICGWLARTAVRARR